ncbi:MAG: dioxygenase [Anaerolineaceae bacterium]|nr:dioxygenase [Anaerolineaceae bacterium]
MSENSTQTKAQVVYFSHGGGPLPILGDPSHRAMVVFMKALPKQLKRPEAILVISAHWEEPVATVLNAPQPPLLYDYYGFPEKAYEITYPAPGSPELAEKVVWLLNDHQIPTGTNPVRGFDHGMFIPLKMMYPEANIPTTQLSLLRGLDAAAHLQLGQALRPLMNENILIIGSGFSFHNMREFFNQEPGASDPKNEAFQDWLIETCAGSLDETDRLDALLHWEQAPNARYCHPREEHLLPALVCAALANTPAKVVFDDQILNKRAVAFLWG